MLILLDKFEANPIELGSVLSSALKKQVGEKRVYSDYTFIWLFILKDIQDNNSNVTVTWRQELMQRL